MEINRAMAQQVWLSPNGPPNAHYSELFASTATWPVAASNTQVFMVSTQFFVHSADSDIGTLLSGVRQAHFNLALSGLMLNGTDKCGHGVEGYTGPLDIRRTSERIKALGGQLSYVVMDGPLLFGHLFAGRNSCQDSIQDVAQQVAEKIAQARQIFPAIKVGDSEPIGHPRPGLPGGRRHMVGYAYQKATGEPLAFFHWDVDWSSRNWPRPTE